MFNNHARKSVAMALVLATCVSAYSANAQPGSADGKRRGPPQEAFDACAELDTGDSCKMTGRRGEELQGTCIVPREEDEGLVCAPEGMRERGERGEREEG